MVAVFPAQGPVLLICPTWGTINWPKDHRQTVVTATLLPPCTGMQQTVTTLFRVVQSFVLK